MWMFSVTKKGGDSFCNFPRKLFVKRSRERAQSRVRGLTTNAYSSTGSPPMRCS